MRRALAAVLFLALASSSIAAQAPPPKREAALTLQAGAATYATRGEDEALWVGRLTLTQPIGAKVDMAGRCELAATQDPTTSLTSPDPKLFRSIECAGVLSYRLNDGLSVGPVVAATWLAPWTDVDVSDPRLWTVALALRTPLKGSGHLYVGGGHYGPGCAPEEEARFCPGAFASADIPTGGGEKAETFATLGVRFPFRRDVFDRRLYQIVVGESVRFKSLKPW